MVITGSSVSNEMLPIMQFNRADKEVVLLNVNADQAGHVSRMLKAELILIYPGLSTPA